MGAYKRWLDKLDTKLVRHFGGYCEVRSLDFFIKWGEATEKKRGGRLYKRLYDWFCKYYSGFVIPTDGSLSRGNAIMPYESIMELIKRAKVGQIWPCSCKSFRPTDEGVPRATCMFISDITTIDNDIVKYPDKKFLPAQEIFDTLRECEEAGLVHQIMCVSNPQGRKMYVLCNCDNKACVPMFLKCRYDVPMVRGSGWLCSQNADTCSGCGGCAKRCPFSAITMVDGKPQMTSEKCLGCGVCVTKCPTKSRSMHRHATEPIHEYTAKKAEAGDGTLERD